MDEAADDKTADRTQDQDRYVGPGDDRARNAEEQSEGDADHPARPGQMNATDDRSDGEALDERRAERRGFVRKRHRQHESHGNRAEDETRDHSQQLSRHGVHFCVSPSMRTSAIQLRFLRARRSSRSSPSKSADARRSHDESTFSNMLTLTTAWRRSSIWLVTRG